MNYIQYMKPGSNFNSSQWDFNAVDKSKLTPEQIKYAVEQYFWRTKDPEMKKQYELWSDYQKRINASQNTDPMSDIAASAELPEVTITMAKPNYIDQIKSDIRNKWTNMSTEDKVHAGIDAATTIGGFIPGVDVVADSADILHSLQRKDWAGAGIGAAAMVLPFVSAPMLRRIVGPQSIGDILKSFKIGGKRVDIQHQPVTIKHSQKNIEEELGKLGIPKGERKQWLKGNTANAAWNTGLGLNNSKYMQHLTDLHFKLAAPKTQTSGIYLNESRYGQNFNVFDRNKIAGPNAEGYIFDRYSGDFVGIYNPPYRGFFFRPLETQNKMIAQGFASMDGMRAYRLNITNPRVTKSATSKQLYKLWDPRHDQYVPSENNGLIRYTSRYDTPFEVQAMDPKQIKLYQWNTYDDAGNLIPLSQRHNFTNKDIRYKSGGSIKIKKKNKGKFAKVRDYVDYKNSK